MKETLESRLGEKLHALRKKKNLTLPELAKGTGVGQRCLSDYEKGVRVPGIKNLSKLGVFFKVLPASFLK